MKNWWQRHKIFLVVWLTMFSSVSARSQSGSKMGKNSDFMKLVYPGGPIGRISASKIQMHFSPENDKESRRILFIKQDKRSGVQIPTDIYYKQSGMMCKLEWKLEKTSHIPFRFRIGSLADCNAMEGKR